MIVYVLTIWPFVDELGLIGKDTSLVTRGIYEYSFANLE